MKIDLIRLPPEGATVEGEDAPEVMDLEAQDALSPLAPLGYRVHAVVVSDELIVRGRISTRLKTLCSRCAVWSETDVSEPEFFVNRQVDETTEVADLTEDMREAIILALPSYPVCRQECQGLCSQCGKNLNEGPCECQPPSDDVRWGGLDELKIT